jgi:hypothetical protein
MNMHASKRAIVAILCKQMLYHEVLELATHPLHK